MAGEYALTGLQRTYLETVRDRVDPKLDRPDLHEFAVSLDDEGVARLRPATVADQLDWLIANWIYESGPESSIGEIE